MLETKEKLLVKNSPGWDLLSMTGVSAEKIQKNMNEVSLFLTNDVSNILSIIDRFQPLELVKMACWEQRRISNDRPNDMFAQVTASRLVWYLQSVVAAKKPPYSQNSEIKEKDWKRLVQLFEDLCSKSIRYADNYALSLYADQQISTEEMLVAFQNYATDSILPPPTDRTLLEKQHNALKYQLQPFNSLIAEVFDAKLDGLLTAFAQLARNAHEGIDKLSDDSTAFKQASMSQLELLKSRSEPGSDMQELMDQVVREQGWEGWVSDIVGRRDGYDLFAVQKLTDLSVSDALVLALDAGQNHEFLEDDKKGWLTKASLLSDRPFLRIFNSVFCFDGDTLLDRAYSIIRKAVCAKSEELENRWRAIEQEKQSLLSITFFSSMLGTMNYTRKVLHGDGYIDAVFEDSKHKLGIQIPASHLGYTPYNPFEQTQDALLQLEGELDAVRLLQDVPYSTVVIDITNRESQYPLALKDNKLTLSLIQLVDLATSWDGMAQIKELVGLPTLGNQKHHQEDEEEQKPKDQEAPVLEGDTTGEEPPVEENEIQPSGYESLDDDLFIEDDFHLEDDSDQDHDSESEFDYFDEIDEDEREAADDMALSELQPTLFNLDDELMFSKGNLVENSDLDDDDDDLDEYEHEAICIIGDYQVDEDLPQMGSSLVQADEQMEGDLEDDSKLYDYTQYSQESEDAYLGENPEGTPPEIPKEKPSSPLSFFGHLSSIANVSSSKPKEPTISDEPIEDLELAEEPELIEESSPTNRLAMPPVSVEAGDMEPSVEPVSKVQSSPRFILAETVSQKGEDVPVVSEEKELIHLEELESSLDGSLPNHLRDILGKLEEKGENVFFDFCKTAEEGLLKTTASLIEQARQAQQSDNKDKMFTIPGFDLTVVLITGRSDMLCSWDRKNNVAAIMYSQGKTSWEVLYLSYAPSGTLIQAEERSICFEDFSHTDWKYVLNLGERILERKKGGV